MLPKRLAAAADSLWNYQTASPRPGALPELEAQFADLSIDDGLAIQTELHRRRAAGGAAGGGAADGAAGGATDQTPLVGYKVGLTSPRARKAVGSDTRPFGHLTRLVENGASLASVIPGWPRPSKGLGAISIETEMCFEVAKPIAGESFDPAQVPEHVAGVFAGFEINERRLTPKAGLALLVADNLTNWAIVKGTGVPPPPADVLDDTRVVVTCNGEERLACTAAEMVDNPYQSIAALAATLHRHGLGLEPGQLVITGAYITFALDNNDASQTWRAEYSGIGAVEVR